MGRDSRGSGGEGGDGLGKEREGGANSKTLFSKGFSVGLF